MKNVTDTTIDKTQEVEGELLEAKNLIAKLTREQRERFISLLDLINRYQDMDTTEEELMRFGVTLTAEEIRKYREIFSAVLMNR